MNVPWLPAGQTVVLDGRGEFFYRHHRHADPLAPTVLLLHGWTASADLQFFTAYEALARVCSFVAIDHRGHGRSVRFPGRFELEDAADDAAALLRHLDLDDVTVVGYSMGGPITMLLAHRHPELVSGVVLQATALEWRSTLLERVRWKTVRMIGPIVRSWAFPSWLRVGIGRMAKEQPTLAAYVAWLAGEVSRNDALHLVHAGQALSRHDARLWAGLLGKPAGVLVTTQDRLVKPHKQRRLASELGAHVMELRGDHLAPWMQPAEFADLTVQLVQHVATESASALVAARLVE
jgi:pimeloyl-ACP methyl ester carboxylesterase